MAGKWKIRIRNIMFNLFRKKKSETEPEPPVPRRVELLRIIAEHYGWREIKHDESQKLLRFKKGGNDLIDIWYSTMTIGTTITHPVRGRNTLFRRNVNADMLKKVLRNPRFHTNEGYHKK